MALIRTSKAAGAGSETLLDYTLLDISTSGTATSASAVVGKRVVARTTTAMSTAPTLTNITLVDFTVGNTYLVGTATDNAIGVNSSGHSIALFIEP